MIISLEFFPKLTVLSGSAAHMCKRKDFSEPFANVSQILLALYNLRVHYAASDPGSSEGRGGGNMKYKAPADGGHLFYD